MSPSRKFLCGVYALLALLALIGTRSHNLAYLDLGFIGANQKFWLDTLVTPASTSITVDIFIFGFAANIWMVLEARRIGLHWVWLYVLGGMLVAISVTFPLYMLHHERILAQRGESALPLALGRADIFGLLLLGVACTTFTLSCLSR